MKEDNIRYFKCQFTQQIALCNFDVFILASNCTPSSKAYKTIKTSGTVYGDD